MKKILMGFSAALLLAGCATQSTQETLAPEVAPQWRQAQQGDALTSIVTRDWWRSFGSTELDGLLETAQLQSYDLAAAVARVRQAQAAATIAGAALLPELNGNVGATRNGRLGGDGNGTPSGTVYQAGLTASYELDFWGRTRALRDSARADLRAAEFDRDTVYLTVTAGVASAWLQTMGLRERAAIADLSVASAQRLLGVIESRARAGAANPLELAQQRGVLAAQMRARAAIRQQAEDSQTTLAVLLGRNPSLLSLAATDLKGLQAPTTGAGLPAALLTRRPDIARAEAQLARADANIIAARAAMLPRITLGGEVTAGSNRVSSVFDNPVYSLAAGLAAPIFNAGRLAAGRDLALAQREELLANYRRAIVAAFGDVETALNALSGIDAQRTAQDEELRQAQRAFDLAESRYRAGAETSLTLLDAQRTLYTAQDAAAQLRTLRLQASVSLYKALGGGWQATVAGPQG
ncbi:transporter [Herminiimonas sp. KBW02]|uniref:efflux transporter outer membrane subunit n=1 Tax=Herminiimonas sp. KBW02 TaxID=2153363 RepID=UPI000F5B1CD7|nr:efflux transporter outer membrane subunit [Herminiimonas sp. KBW02]RQO36992.1 transporter [Herminiimonas sp. KBW02]